MDAGVALCISETQNLFLKEGRGKWIQTGSQLFLALSLVSYVDLDLLGWVRLALHVWQMGRCALKIMVTT